MKKIVKLSMIFCIYILILSSVSYASFNDVTGHWCEAQINNFKEGGFVEGYEDGTFRPDIEITRAEFCKIINSYMGYDVSGEWKNSNIAIAKEKGYLQVGEANTTISREEAFVSLSRAMNLENVECEIPFIDSGEISLWAVPSVKNLLFVKYIKGYEDNFLKPKQNITRAEVVAVLHEFVGIGGIIEEPLDMNFAIGCLVHNEYGLEFIEINNEIEMQCGDIITLAATLAEENDDIFFEIVSGEQFVRLDKDTLILEAIANGEARIEATTLVNKERKEILIKVK